MKLYFDGEEKTKSPAEWWSAKVFREYESKLRVGGIEWFRDTLPMGYSHPVNAWLHFYDVIVDYLKGLGFVFRDYSDYRHGDEEYNIVRERTLYYTGIKDRTIIERYEVNEDFGETNVLDKVISTTGKTKRVVIYSQDGLVNIDYEDEKFVNFMKSLVDNTEE